MALFHTSAVQNGTGSSDFLIGDRRFANSNTLNGNGGNDLLYGDFSSFIGDPQQYGSTAQTAVSIDAPVNWSLSENQDIANATTIPHTTVYFGGNLAGNAWWSVTASAGAAITIDIDYGNHPIGDGLMPNLIVQLWRNGNSLLATSSTSAGGGLGSVGTNDPFLQYTATEAGVYQIRVIGIDDIGVDFLMHASVTGHAEAGAYGDFNDTLNGGDGDDSLYGFAGDDILNGDGGADLLVGGSGRDTMNGDDGSDTYIVDSVSDIVVETNAAAAGGIDRIVTSVTRTLGANLEQLSLSGAGNINGNGNALGNYLVGNAGNNLLNGGEGNDLINGAAGNDLILGGAGVDVLTGGVGLDSFVFSTPSPSFNRDMITDFVAADDTIRLENAVFTALGAATGALAAAKFKANASGIATDADDRIVYNTTTGALIYDVNGSGAGGAFQFATLLSKPAITAADFFVI